MATEGALARSARRLGGVVALAVMLTGVVKATLDASVALARPTLTAPRPPAPTPP